MALFAERYTRSTSLKPPIHRQFIRIVANYGAAIDFLPEDIADFMADHPATRVILEQRASPDVVQAVAEGRADIGVSARPSAPTPMSPSFLIGKTISSS